MSRFQDVIDGKNPSYLAPLFWQHGESESVLREEIRQMNENGVGGFVVESRPHPDFLGERWWHDLDVLLDEARKREMKLWIFDDSAYPSGFSAGLIKEAHPEYLKVYLDERHIDPIGPLSGSSFIIRAWLDEGESLVRVVAGRRTDREDQFDAGTLVDLTDRVVDGILYWDVPEGDWRIYIIVSTRKGGEEWTRDYLNPLVSQATQAYLDFVYEPHYRRYADDFGHTIAGYFSDEPRFGNAATYEAALGRYKMVLPYAPDLLSALSQAWGEDFARYLPCLWYEGGDQTPAVRYTYMDVVSRLFAVNFSQKIGSWCQSHGVRLIGHIVEDNGAHARLGYGPGHFFRSISGQHTSGLDLVYQVWPEYNSGRFTTPFGYLDSDFFYWGIAKMASSAGHIDPKKDGTTICEVFGAYGWQEGLKLMKWLTDFICVRGINFIIPHAFSPKAKDPDCPPHFYSRGENPQWRYFHVWSAYANRLCHLLSGGKHIASAVVVYHAEAEWAGDYEPFEKVVKALAQRQIDVDVVPEDTFINLENWRVEQAQICIHQERYPVVVIPHAERLPAAFVSILLDLARRGVRVIFTHALPTGFSQGAGKALLADLQAEKNCFVFSHSELVDALIGWSVPEVETDSPEDALRCYHYQGEEDLFFFTNESRLKAISCRVRLRRTGTPVFYDAMDNRFIQAETVEKDGRSELFLHLEPYQSIFAVFDAPAFVGTTRGLDIFGLDLSQQVRIEKNWTVQTAGAREYPAFKAVLALSSTGNTAIPGRLPGFSGTFQYQNRFEIPFLPSGRVLLDLGSVYEIAEVWVNDHAAGARICPPYLFDITGLVQAGGNTLRIEVTNTLAKERGDNEFDRAMPQEPSGLIGPVSIRYQA